MPSDAPQPATPLPDPASGTNPIEQVYRVYTALASTSPFDPHSGLGGKLLYAGALHAQARNLLVAANIAGAASLAASADPMIQRQAMRDGVVDFLVTTLEEALRILKNEIRKRQTVSVGVAADPRQLTMQMVERGVLPDLLPPASWSESETGSDQIQIEKLLAQGARQVTGAGSISGSNQFVTWSVDRHPARWLPRLDACAQTIVPAADVIRQRWLRLSPRYLGRLAQRERGVPLSADEKARFQAEAERMIAMQPDDGGELVKATFSVTG